MREVELKAVAADPDAVLAALHAAGAERTFAGKLTDRRYDTPDRSLVARDHVLRLRIYTNASGSSASLDWKGPTSLEGGYKVRDEVSTGLTDADALAQMLDSLGYTVTREIDRHITQFLCEGAIVRIERYPRMDALVEVEGMPDEIEAAVVATGIPRDGFTAERLPDFVRRYEARTGERAALCDRELSGDYRFSATDA